MILCNFFLNVEKILILIKRAFLKNKIFRKLHLHKRSVLLEEKKLRILQNKRPNPAIPFVCKYHHYFH